MASESEQQRLAGKYFYAPGRELGVKPDYYPLDAIKKLYEMQWYGAGPYGYPFDAKKFQDQYDRGVTDRNIPMSSAEKSVGRELAGLARPMGGEVVGDISGSGNVSELRGNAGADRMAKNVKQTVEGIPYVPKYEPGLITPQRVNQKGVKVSNNANDVMQWQKTLQDLGYYNGQIDGVYGPATLAATRVLQHQLHVSKPDGIVGTETRAKAARAVKSGELPAPAGFQLPKVNVGPAVKPTQPPTFPARFDEKVAQPVDPRSAPSKYPSRGGTAVPQPEAPQVTLPVPRPDVAPAPSVRLTGGGMPGRGPYPPDLRLSVDVPPAKPTLAPRVSPPDNVGAPGKLGELLTTLSPGDLSNSPEATPSRRVQPKSVPTTEVTLPTPEVGATPATRGPGPVVRTDTLPGQAPGDLLSPGLPKEDRIVPETPAETPPEPAKENLLGPQVVQPSGEIPFPTPALSIDPRIGRLLTMPAGSGFPGGLRVGEPAKANAPADAALRTQMSAPVTPMSQTSGPGAAVSSASAKGFGGFSPVEGRNYGGSSCSSNTAASAAQAPASRGGASDVGAALANFNDAKVNLSAALSGGVSGRTLNNKSAPEQYHADLMRQAVGF